MVPIVVSPELISRYGWPDAAVVQYVIYDGGKGTYPNWRAFRDRHLPFLGDEELRDVLVRLYRRRAVLLKDGKVAYFPEHQDDTEAPGDEQVFYYTMRVPFDPAKADGLAELIRMWAGHVDTSRNKAAELHRFLTAMFGSRFEKTVHIGYVGKLMKEHGLFNVIRAALSLLLNPPSGNIASYIRAKIMSDKGEAKPDGVSGKLDLDLDL